MTHTPATPLTGEERDRLEGWLETQPAHSRLTYRALLATLHATEGEKARLRSAMEAILILARNRGDDAVDDATRLREIEREATLALEER